MKTMAATTGASRPNFDAVRMRNGAGEAAEHRERRQDEHEMPDAVVHRGLQRDRDGKGQQAASAIRRKTARRLNAMPDAKAASIAPAAPPNPSTEKITGSLSANSVGT